MEEEKIIYFPQQFKLILICPKYKSKMCEKNKLIFQVLSKFNQTTLHSPASSVGRARDS